MVAHLQAAGIVFHFDVSLSEVKRAGRLSAVTPDFELETDLVIGATGRTPNLGALHLEQAHVDYGKKASWSMSTCKPTAPYLCLWGCLAKEAPKLTPVASYEAKYAVTRHDEATNQPLTYLFAHGGLGIIGSSHQDK